MLMSTAHYEIWTVSEGKKQPWFCDAGTMNEAMELATSFAIPQHLPIKALSSREGLPPHPADGIYIVEVHNNRAEPAPPKQDTISCAGALASWV